MTQKLRLEKMIEPSELLIYINIVGKIIVYITMIAATFFGIIATIRSFYD